MTTTEKPAADNGVDVPFLLGARTALTDEPAGAQFQWRAETEWVKGTQSRGTVKTFFGLGEEQEHTSTFTLRRRPPPAVLRPRTTAPPRWRSCSSRSAPASPAGSRPSRSCARSSSAR